MPRLSTRIRGQYPGVPDLFLIMFPSILLGAVAEVATQTYGLGFGAAVTVAVAAGLAAGFTLQEWRRLRFLPTLPF